MKKKEIKARVRELLSAGVAKSEVFDQLAGQGIRDRQLAYFIASYADPHLCETHRGKVNILIAVMFVQTILAFIVGFDAGTKIGPNAKWILGGLIALIPLLFAWGFHRHAVGAYNAYIFLTIVQLPQQFQGFTSAPIASSIGLAIGIGILAFVWYLRQKLFPDFVFITPKKVRGKYVFAG